MTADEECAPQCAAGFTKIKTQTGLNIPVFNIKRTSPALHIGYGNNICYAELLPGESDKAINVRYNNAIYHTWANESETRCDAGRSQYLIQYYCIDGPIGTQLNLYSWCRTGDYAINPQNFNTWYSGCALCTNGPANSHYTSYCTPSVMCAVEDNCPWECNDGYTL